MQTVKDIDKVFRDIVDAHQILQSYHTIGTKELDIDKLTVIATLLYANCTSCVDASSLEFSYEVIVGDLAVEDLKPNW